MSFHTCPSEAQLIACAGVRPATCRRTTMLRNSCLTFHTCPTMIHTNTHMHACTHACTHSHTNNCLLQVLGLPHTEELQFVAEAPSRTAMGDSPADHRASNQRQKLHHSDHAPTVKSEGTEEESGGQTNRPKAGQSWHSIRRVVSVQGLNSFGDLDELVPAPPGRRQPAGRLIYLAFWV